MFRNKAFTLIEVMTVCMIIALLLAIAIPNLMVHPKVNNDETTIKTSSHTLSCQCTDN